MPAQRFWFPGLEKKLSKVVWKVAGGLLYVHVEWVWNLFRAIGAPPDAEPTEAGGPSNLTPPNPYLITISGLPGYDPFQINVHQEKRGTRVEAPSVAKPKPAIEDPVTTGMLGHYVYWTPPNADPPFYFTATKTDTSASVVWIVDTANWQLVYNHIITSHLAGRMSREQAINEFKGLAGSTGYEGVTDPNLIGVIIEQVFTFVGGTAVGAPHDPPYPPSAEGYAFWSAAAASGWSGHLENLPTAGPTKGAKGSADLIINVAQVQRELTKAQKDANRWTFNVTMPEDKYAQPYVSVAAFPATKAGDKNYKPRKTFPVGPTMQRPVHTDFDSFVETGERGADDPGVKANTVYRVTVQIKPLKLLAMELVSGGLGGDIVIG